MGNLTEAMMSGSKFAEVVSFCSGGGDKGDEEEEEG